MHEPAKYQVGFDLVISAPNEKELKQSNFERKAKKILGFEHAHRKYTKLK
jgi:hypothetical protein